MAIAEKINMAMAPVIPMSEPGIAYDMDKWLGLTRQLEKMQPEYALPNPCKITALQTILTIGRSTYNLGQVMRRGTGHGIPPSYDEVVSQCRESATKRRLDANMRRASGPDLDEANTPGYQDNPSVGGP